MKRYLIPIAIFFVTFIPWAITNGLSLEQAVEEAMNNNPEILALKKKWESGETKIPKIRSWVDPQLGVSYEEIPQGSYALGEAEMRVYSISQMIPYPGKISRKSKMAQEDAGMAKQEYQDKRDEIAAKVKSAYYTLLFLQQAIEINGEVKNLIQQLAKIAETKYAVGESPLHDVLQAQMAFALVVDDLIVLEEEKIPTAEINLNLMLNRPPHLPLGLLEQAEVSGLKQTVEELENLALARHPKLKRAEYAVNKNKDALALAKMQYFPDFMVKLMREDMRMATGTRITKGIMLSANIPLWFRKQGLGIEEKKAELSAAELSYQAMKNMVLLQIQQEFAKCKASERRMRLFQTTILPQAEQALKASLTAYETGKVDFLSLMSSEQKLRDVRLKYYNLLSEHGKNIAQLERAVGIKLE